MKKTLILGWAELPLPDGIGQDLTGFLARENPSTGMRDPLYARAICIGDGKTKIVWVSVDVLALGQALVDRVRMTASSAHHLPPRAFAISATHTHSGPATIFLANAGVVDRTWLRELEETLIEVIARAVRDATHRVWLRYAQVDASGYSYNRRRYKPGETHASGTNGRGALDTTLTTIVAHEERSGKPFAAIVHFACHPVFHRDQLISADWPGRMLGSIRSEMGDEFRCMFVQGACGDIDPISLADTPEENVARMGDGLARKALGLIVDPALGTRLGPTVNSRLRTISLPWQREIDEAAIGAHLLSPAEWTRADKHGQAWHIWARRVLVSRSRGWWAEGMRMPVQVVVLGELAIVGIGAETFSGTSLALKAAHPERSLIVAGYANDAVGYLPPAEEYPQGGYEIERAYRFYGMPEPFAPEAEEIVRKTVDDILAVGTMTVEATR